VLTVIPASGKPNLALSQVGNHIVTGSGDDVRWGGVYMNDFRALISIASRIIHDGQVCLNKALMEIGLGSAEANVLMFLFSGGDGVRQDDIVAATEVSKPAISRTVASLEAKGYVVRETSLSDKRSRIVRLTEKAKAIQDVIEQRYFELVSAAARDIPEDKVLEFMAMFTQVARNIAQYREEISGTGKPPKRPPDKPSDRNPST
jgi:DNA-binding MarR family transcriptional regulator